MNEPKLYDEMHTFDVKSTVFVDGMVVTAGDLDVAMRYPIELMQTLIRAYFGCGIVCGLNVHKEPPDTTEHTFCVKIEPGVALDCHGHPLRLCSAVKIDLTPDPCCDCPPQEVCIAIRRDTQPEAPRKDAGRCGGNGASSGAADPCQYRREHEGVRVKVFLPDDLPDKNVCRRKPPETSSDREGSLQQRYCECMTECECCCCGEAWVLLACITLGECDVAHVDMEPRKFVKPIECFCGPQEVKAASNARIVALQGVLKKGDLVRYRVKNEVRTGAVTVVAKDRNTVTVKDAVHGKTKTVPIGDVDLPSGSDWRTLI